MSYFTKDWGEAKDEKRVELNDFSYGLVLNEDGSLTNNLYTQLGGVPANPNRFLVIAENCQLPTERSGNHGGEGINNIILRQDETGIIVFSQKEFTRPIRKYCRYCGRKVKE